MARRILNRKDLRTDFEAAERRKAEDEEQEEATEEEEAEAGEEDEDEEEEAEDEAEATDEAEEPEEEEAPKKKKKPAKPKAKPRTRTPKITRMKVVWGVFNNSNQRVATYEYPKRKDAEDHAAKLTTDKKSTHFVQPVKEPLEEKKET